jgi:tetratricopeptide (TPR) repeat protein
MPATEALPSLDRCVYSECMKCAPLIAAIFLFSPHLAGQTAPVRTLDSPLSAGKIVPKVVCAAHSDQTYALYLPGAYTPQKRWPIVYVFDPGARGMVPTQLMKDAAEHYGYIIVASNNSKNGPWKPEMEAASAMWDDTHSRLSVDERRIYLAGFSGGARVASQIAQRCNCAHGVFMSGAGFSPGSPPAPDKVFAVFLTAGMLDFNYNELVHLESQLSSLGFPHFLRRFDGAHEWAPAGIWPEAFAWMNLLAMKEKRWQRDDAFIAAELQHFTVAAQKIEKAGNPLYSAQVYRQAAAAFDGLASVDLLRERAAALEKDASYRAAEKRERDDLALQSSLENEVLRVTSGLREPTVDRTQLRQQAAQLIEDLRARATHERKEEKRRVLERARRGVFANMIETGEPLIDEKNLALAEIYLGLAAEARPEIPWPHVSLAQCLLKMGRKKEALQSLQRAKDAGLKSQDLANLETQIPEFAALAFDPAFQKLVEGLHPESSDAQ